MSQPGVPADDDDEPGYVSIGAEFHVTPEAAEEFRAAFRSAIEELLEDWDEESIIDYGMD